MFIKKTLSKKWSAESLIEALISITLVSIIIFSVANNLRNVIYWNQAIGKKSIAIDLALNATEALHNIRDANYLHFASDPDNCWDKLNVSDVSECSSGAAEEITDGNYYLSRSFDAAPYLEWGLEEVSTNEDGYLDLYEVDLESDGTADLELYAQSDVIRPEFKLISSNVFRRILTVSRNPGEESYEANITVSWELHDNISSISFPTTIAHIY